MGSVTLNSIKEFKKSLEKVDSQSKGLKSGSNIPLPDLFPDKFMKKYTDFANIERMLKVSGLEVTPKMNLEKLNQKSLEETIQGRTMFNNWKEMLLKAGREYIATHGDE